MAEVAKPRPAARGRAPRPFWREALAAIWSGVAEPSGLALGTFLVALAAMLGLCLWFFSEETLAGPWGRFLPTRVSDVDAFVTVEALRTGLVEPERPRLIVLGTSTVAQAVGSGRELAARLRETTGQDWEVVMLTSPDQPPLDQFALAERALESQGPDSPVAVVALGIGLGRLQWTPAFILDRWDHTRRTGLVSDWADAELVLLGDDPAPRIGLFAFDNARFMLRNGARSMLRLLVQQAVPRRVDQYARVFAGPPPAEVRALLGRQTRAAEWYVSGYLAQIGRLSGRIATVPNARLVLIEELLSPEAVEGEGLVPLQQSLTAARAAHPHVGKLPFWRLGVEAGLEAADFFDDQHLKTGGAQAAVQRTLAADIAALVAGGKGETDNGG